ncbi:MAG: hypothetical protein AAFN77_01750 [Planctomycetota bacterium]
MGCTRAFLVEIFVIAVCIAGVGLVPIYATANPPQQAANVAGIEYAELRINDDSYTFDVSSSPNLPRSFSLVGLYRNLGGNLRPTKVNLLGEIGADGWQLIDVSNDRSIYTFAR